MHELGVVFHVIKMVEEICEENNLTEIESVTLELGEVSTVIESYLHDVWKAMKNAVKAVARAPMRSFLD